MKGAIIYVSGVTYLSNYFYNYYNIFIHPFFSPVIVRCFRVYK